MTDFHRERRPIRSRNTKFAKNSMLFLKKLGFKPNHISLLSLVFASLAAYCFVLSKQTTHYWYTITLLAAVIFICLRLLCNLFDGMLAIEGNFDSKAGEIYNDLPDRPSDIFILLGVSYAAHNMTLGWLAALLTVMTAYIRLLGKTAGTQQFFIGPMAKQHRMAIIIITTLLVGVMGQKFAGDLFRCCLSLIIIGCIITIYRRLKCILHALNKVE